MMYRVLVLWVVLLLGMARGLAVPQEERRVVITGGGGFLGTRLTQYLCRQGWNVTVVDDLSAEHARAPRATLDCPAESLRFLKMSCVEYFERKESWKTWDLFVHLASVRMLGSDSMSDTNQLEHSLAVTENLAIDAAAFRWVADPKYQAKGLNIGRVVCVDTSSTTVNASPTISFFANMILAHSSIKGKVIRTGSLYGNGQPYHEGDDGISRLLHEVATRKENISVSVNRCDTYLHVDDAVEEIFNAIKSERSDEVVNLDGGVLTRDMDVLRELIGYDTSYRPTIKEIDTPNAEHFCSNSVQISEEASKFLPYLNYRCKTMRQGLIEMWQHAKSNTSTNAGEKNLYSSVTCTAGHQGFPSDWNFYNDDYNSPTNRICKFENICLLDNQLVYFHHEAERKAPEHAKYPTNEIFVFLSLTGLLDLKITPVEGPVPKHFEFIDDNTWLFTLASYSFNFAHLLLDELYSALGALGIFHIPQDEGRLLYYGCTSHHDKVNLYDRENPHKHAYDFEKPTVQVCEDNMKLYSKLVLGHEAVELNEFNDKTFCFKRLIMGQGYVLSSGYVDKQRPVQLRQGRDLILSNLGLSGMPPPTNLSIMILPKKIGFYSSAWPNMCNDVTDIVRNDMKLSDISIHCLPHDGSLSVTDEIMMMQRATLVIAEHGTISFVPLYAQDGTVLLSVGTKEKLKDGQTLLYTTHLQVFYTAIEEIETMGDFIRFGLFRASENFNIPYDVS